MEENKRELSFYRLYLQQVLDGMGDSRMSDHDFIDNRADLAEEAFEEARRDGLAVEQAQELAMEVLLEGVEELGVRS